ncbi:MAG: ribosome biogenesis GTP-binding protein YihA/YsxC [Pseudomonadota bacterium]
MGQHHRDLQEGEENADLSAGAARPQSGTDGDVQPLIRNRGEASGEVEASEDSEASETEDERALEAGRLLFAAPWAYLRSCHDLSQLPPSGPVEVAFAGRSNVGKSTLINALVGQKGLAKASNTPGRTRALNLFAREDGTGPLLVDMPGYGYARAPKTEVAQWTRLVFRYLRGRPGLRRVYLLIDGRHGLKAMDEPAIAAMDEAAVSYQVVLTKADKGPGPDVLNRTREALAKHPAAHPQVIVTSAAGGGGIATLRAAIADLCASSGLAAS